VIGFQLANGFTPIGVLPKYLPFDEASGGFAAHMVWRNPYVDPSEPPAFRVPRDVESVRLATVQFQARAVKNFAEFVKNVEYFVDVAANYRANFVVFPELFTMSLLSFETEKLSPMAAIDRMTEHRAPIVAELSRMALRYNINIVGGSHPTRTADGSVQNVAYVCLRDGSVHAQEKIHPTPNEAYWWKIKGGSSVDVIQTDVGPVGVLICYDSEFPELARRLVDQGARIIFVPFCTDNRQGYMRVR
jgi:predicted amidohydrolase